MSTRVALVTGASRGIGAATARRLAAEGCAVAVNYNRSRAEALALAEEINAAGGRAMAVKADVAVREEVENMVDNVLDKFCQLDILVCNAGITIHNWATDYPIEDIDKVFDLDIRGYYLCARTAARYMKQQGKGSIVMISSANSVIYHSKRSLYNVSKSATAGMAGTLGVELARFGIRVNAVGPGYVATDLVKQGVENGTIKMDKNFQVIPDKRFIEVEEIASVVAFLASDEASAINGQNILADLGWSKNALPEDTDME